MKLAEEFHRIRQHTVQLCIRLETEDYGLQPVSFVSPAKWHLAHTTWFFETFILKPHLLGYKPYNDQFHFFYNSYYEALGARTLRAERGQLSRPTVREIYDYRSHVDEQMQRWFELADTTEFEDLVILGFQHEQQHQELLITDLKYALSLNPLFPAVLDIVEQKKIGSVEGFVHIPEGMYEIGFEGDGFCFDNELGRHKVFLPEFSIDANLVTAGQYQSFVEAGGYESPEHWHQEGWEWVKNNHISHPLYWHYTEDGWKIYTLNGLKPLEQNAPLAHVSWYEAAAFASWSCKRLPTEFEWEVASPLLGFGSRWEWTNSAYLPYPGYKKLPGALGEYNGKFMVNQMVLRGASVATPEGHSRATYRNFFHADMRWQFTGIRLAE